MTIINKFNKLIFMKKILFLCTGNYYRSRFSEYLFNYLASKKGIKWQADSRGLNVNPQSGNVGSISLEVIKALEGLDIQLDSVSLREPMQVKQTDLENATQIIAVDEVAHRPLMQSKFPEWVDKIEYWEVKDLDENPDQPPLLQIQNNLSSLLENLD